MVQVMLTVGQVENKYFFPQKSCTGTGIRTSLGYGSELEFSITFFGLQIKQTAESRQIILFVSAVIFLKNL